MRRPHSERRHDETIAFSPRALFGRRVRGSHGERLGEGFPPTPEGAQKLSAVFATYLGKPADGAPSLLTVSPEGGHYTVALDLAALFAPLKSAGFAFDPARLEYALTEQDDGTWRVTSDAIPPLSFHARDAQYAYKFADYKFDGLFDPALPGFRTGNLGIGAYAAEIHTPAMDETIAVVSSHGTSASTPAANGAVALVGHQDIADLSGKVLPPAPDKAGPAPAPVSFQGGPTLVDVSVDGAPICKLLDLWAFFVAHPTRPQMAADEQTLKALLRALAPADLKLVEKVEMKKLSVGAPQGTFGVTGGKFTLAAATPPGPKGSGEYGFAVDGLTLPPGLLPPAMTDLVPTSFSVAMKASGFDVAAGANEAIGDLHLAGDGPVISNEDGAKIAAKFKGAGPILVELLPSRIAAPQIDLALEGQLHLEGPRPTGMLKIRARNFDNTIAAVKALGPLATPQVLGGLALAKGLAKTEADGALSWIAEYAPDGAISVNGMPLGKAP